MKIWGERHQTDLYMILLLSILPQEMICFLGEPWKKETKPECNSDTINLSWSIRLDHAEGRGFKSHLEMDFFFPGFSVDAISIVY